jgi:hypothetical protein
MFGRGSPPVPTTSATEQLATVLLARQVQRRCCDKAGAAPEGTMVHTSPGLQPSSTSVLVPGGSDGDS